MDRAQSKRLGPPQSAACRSLFRGGRAAAMEAAMTEAAIRIDAVSKIYAGGKQALDSVSFDVPRGQIFGLLGRSEEHTSELQSLMRISYAVFCLKKKKINTHIHHINTTHINKLLQTII